jgi:hypothetical protein
MKSYRVKKATGDKYSIGFVVSGYKDQGINFKPCELTKSDLFKELLPGIMTRQIMLLDNRQQVAELVGLERRTGSVKDRIDHSLRGHDDVANCLAGLNFVLKKKTVEAAIYFSDQDWSDHLDMDEGPSFGQRVFEYSEKLIQRKINFRR